MTCRGDRKHLRIEPESILSHPLSLKVAHNRFDCGRRLSPCRPSGHQQENGNKDRSPHLAPRPGLEPGLPIRPATVIGSRHVNDFVRLVDFVKEPPGADPASPGRRAPVLESFNVRAMVWLGSELRVHVLPQLLFDSAQS